MPPVFRRALWQETQYLLTVSRTASADTAATAGAGESACVAARGTRTATEMVHNTTATDVR